MKSLLLPVMLFSLFMASQARADEWDKATKITFSDAIQVPGTVLDAGTYRFKLLDSPSSRNIVHIFNGDGTKLIQTILAIPNWRLQPSDKTVLVYAERPAGEPQALEAWFYPGDNSGQQFVYPKLKAAELSRLNNTTVPSSEDEQSSNVNPEPAQPVVSSDTSSQPEAAAPTSSEPTEYARVEPEPASEPQPQAQSSTTQSTLPQTSSQLPLVGFGGLLFLGAAVVFRILIGQKG